MSADPCADVTPNLLSERHFEQNGERIDLSIDAEHRAVVVLVGKGSVPGAKLLIEMVDEMEAELPPGLLVTALVDVRKVQGVPLRAQGMLLRRGLRSLHQASRVAIVGAGAFELGVARALAAMAGMSRKVHFGRSVADAIRYLGWPAERYLD